MSTVTDEALDKALVQARAVLFTEYPLRVDPSLVRVVDRAIEDALKAAAPVIREHLAEDIVESIQARISRLKATATEESSRDIDPVIITSWKEAIRDVKRLGNVSPSCSCPRIDGYRITRDSCREHGREWDQLLHLRGRTRPEPAAQSVKERFLADIAGKVEERREQASLSYMHTNSDYDSGEVSAYLTVLELFQEWGSDGEQSPGEGEHGVTDS